MFQYAFGRALAIKNGANLQLDIRHYANAKAFSYGLDRFQIQATVGTDATLPPPKSSRLRYLAWRHLYGKTRVLKEQAPGYSAASASASGNLYLYGYWQSEQYFREFPQAIMDELTPAAPLHPSRATWQQEMQNENSIAVHVRRGDYVTNQDANAYHGTCSIDYYRRGVDAVLQRTNRNATAYVFSDDQQWASQHLNLPCETHYLDQDTRTPHDDLYLMSCCRHQVISNSTYSWWAAWLNRNPSKIVIAPTRWFAGGPANGGDIIPERWHKIDSNCQASIARPSQAA